MAELSKQALKVQNNTEFPNNNAGLITPSKLRGFNVDMIDSLVDEISYTQDSASWNQQIDSLENFTASLGNTFVSTASFNSFTQSFNSFSASVTQSIVDLQNFSASLSGGFVTEGELQAATASLINQINTKLDSASFNSYTQSTDNRLTNIELTTASINVSIANLNAYTASDDNSITQLEAFTQSANLRLTNLEAATASINSSITNLNSATQSLFTSASLGLTTASVSLNTITFSKGDGSTFNLTVDTGSGGGGSVPAGTISGSAQITALGFVSSSVTASSLVTASISGQLLTFTKGNGSTFNLTLPTGSGGSGQAVTASYGAFSDTTTQSGSANVAYPFKFNTVDVVDGVTLSGSTGLQVNSTGVYNIQFSAQGVQGAGAGIGNIWFRQNGLDIPNSDTQFTIPSNQKFVAAWNIFATASAGDHFEIIWRSDSANTTWAFITGSGTSPNSPSIIATVNRIDVGGTADLTPLNQFSASINAFTQSANQRLTAIESVSGSWITESESGSFLITGSVAGNVLTFTKGDNTTFNLTVATGSGGGQTFTNPSIESISGSVLITANTFNSGAANLTHISASAQNQANLLFKNTNNAGSTIVSGSFNLYTNPSAPAAGRLNYLENSNIFLNDSGFLPTVTASVLTAGGTYPRLRNNVWLGTGPWTINTNAFASSSVQAGSFNNNLFLGSTGTTINTLANTGGVSFSHNILASAAATINAPSRSLAQVAAGDSGSTTVNFLNNLALGGTITYNGPVSASATQTQNIQSNTIQGNLALNLQSGSRGNTINNNILNGILTVNDNTAFTPTLGSNSQIIQTNINGSITLTNRASASFNLAANNLGGFTITNDYDSSTNGSVGRQFVLQGNVIIGAIANNIYFSGSAAGTNSTNDRGRGFYGNLIGGSRISASVIGDGNRHFLASAVWGQGLSVYGTGLYDASNASIAGGQNGGSAFFGRWNAENGNRALTAETVFAVGTGTSGSAGIVRKTGFLIDSGSNTFVEGTLNVSGSTSFTGSAPSILSSSFSGSLITNLTDVYTDVSAVNQIVTLTSASYAGLVSGSLTNPNTLYIVSGSTQVNPAFPYTGSAVITGSLTITGSAIGNVVSMSISSNTASMDLSAGNYFELTSSVTPLRIELSNLKGGVTSTLIISASASSSITFSSNVAQPSGSAYSGSAGSIDILSFVAFNTSKVNVVSTKALV